MAILFWAWGGILKAFSTSWFVWRNLPGPVRGFLIAGIAAGAGVVWGEVDGRHRCDARINQSIERARALDASISAEAKQRSDQQAREGSARETAIREEVARYTDELATKVASACAIGADADRNNDGLRLHDDGVSAPVAKPAAPRASHPRPGAVPPRKSQ